MAQGSDSQLDPIVGLEAPERDRLYREWILPHVKLSDAHREFVETVLRVPGAKDFHSFPGQLSIELDDHAPVERLSKLSCCLLSGRTLELSGPREGGLLVPVTDPSGRLVAFRVLSSSQMLRMRDGHQPDTVMWWQAASSLRPMMPNGEQPVHAARSGTADTTVLMRGVARASAIATNWGCHGISTTEETFSFHTTVDYLLELLAKKVLIFSAREPTKKEALKTWTLAEQLVAKEFDVKILVPVLSEMAFPDSIGECASVAIDAWVKGLPKATQQEIVRKKRAANAAESAKIDLSPEELNERIMEAYNEFINEGKKPDIGSLAAAAGVYWEKVMDWLKDRGVDNTSQLQVKMDSGWEPDTEIDPLAPPPETRAREEGPSLFEFADAQKQRSAEESSEATSPADSDVAATETEQPEDTAAPVTEPTPAETDEPSGVIEPEQTAPDSQPPPQAEGDSAAATADGALPEKAEPTVPAPAAETSAATVDENDDSKKADAGRDGTIELVVEAKESILESETPLTQVINSEASETTVPTGTESKARIGLILIAGVLLVVAFALIGTFGLPRESQSEEPWGALPISEKDLLPAVKTPTLSQPVFSNFDVKEIATKIKDARESSAPKPPSEDD